MSKINHQRRAFLSKANSNLHKITQIQQRITLAYHTQLNRLCDWQNCAIKGTLTVVEEKAK